MAFALSGREPSNQPTQGVALGWMLIGLSGRYFSKTLPDTNKNVYEPKEGSPLFGTGSLTLREGFPKLGQVP